MIEPLVRRHAQDAAFYWMQLDGSLYSPRLGVEGIQRFDQMLSAHLEGMQVAGEPGWRLAFEALDRWKKPGEAFVCAWLALHESNEAWISALLVPVGKNPALLMRALISALAWQPQPAARIAAWSTAEQDAIRLVAALRATALIGNTGVGALSLPIASYLQASDEHVRAAACRTAVFVSEDQSPAFLLQALLQDAALVVRVEAAIALASLGYSELAAPAVWQGLLAQADTHASATGWLRNQALRRLMRWARFFAGLAPLGHPNLPALLSRMPARVALSFIAYHGDLAHLPFVLEQIKDHAGARYAGWVLSTLTGLDLREAGLALPEPAPHEIAGQQPVSEARLDADHGLALPDHKAVSHWYAQAAPALPQGQRHLLGTPLDDGHAQAVLTNAAQAMRSIAAQSLIHRSPPHFVSLRGSWAAQQASLSGLGLQG